jgi:hypothetical protein
METLQAKTDRWLNLVGSDGHTKARLNLDTGELVIKLRGECHKWPLRDLLNSSMPQQDAQVLNPP